MPKRSSLETVPSFVSGRSKRVMRGAGMERSRLIKKCHRFPDTGLPMEREEDYTFEGGCRVAGVSGIIPS
jgi:hypothetical protein